MKYIRMPNWAWTTARWSLNGVCALLTVLMLVILVMLGRAVAAEYDFEQRTNAVLASGANKYWTFEEQMRFAQIERERTGTKRWIALLTPSWFDERAAEIESF